MKKFFTLLCTVLIALIVYAQDEPLPSFTVGRFKYEIIDASQKWVQIAPKREAIGTPDDDDYQDTGYGLGPNGTGVAIGRNDIPATVTYNGETYYVKGIGAGAFVNCILNGQAIIELPEGMIFIDNEAFCNTEMGSLKLCNTLQYIAEYAFDGNRLAGISVKADNPWYANLSSEQEERSMSVLTNKEKTKLLVCPGAKPKTFNENGSTTYVTTYVVPEQITEIGDCAFMGNPTLTRVTLHNGITRLGDGAFYESRITSINVPNPDCEIGSSCFSHSRVSSVTLPQGMKKLGRHVFFYCENLKSITLPEGMEELGMMCFGSCALTSVNLPSTMIKLDTCALQDNPFTSIDLKNVKWVGRQCFSQCTNLTTITGNSGQLERICGAAFTRDNAISTPYIPDGLKVLEMNAYFRATGFTSMNIPASVECINGNPAVGATNCAAYNVAADSPYFVSIDGVLYATAGSTVLPEEAGGAAAPRREGADSSTPTALVGVPAAIPNKVLTIPEGVTTICNQAAREVALTELYLPKTMSEIRSAFSSVKTLTKVQCLATTPPSLEANFESDVYQNATLYVPMNSVDAYRAAPGWSGFQNIEGIDTGDEPGAKMYLAGSMTDWASGKEAMTLGEDGKFTITKEMEADAEFKFINENDEWIGGDADGNFIVQKEQVEEGTELSLLLDAGNNFQIPVAGTWTLTVDPENMKLVISGEWNEPAPEPVDVYILGEVNDQTWDPSVGLLMDNNGDLEYYYTAEVTLDGRNDGYNYFSFTTKLAETNDQAGWDFIAPYRFGAVSNGDFLVTDETTEISLTADNGQALKAPAGTYQLSVDRDAMKLFITKTGGTDYPTGDVNGDGKVDVADVNAAINIILELKTPDDYPGTADLTGEGVVDVSDVNLIINIILEN
ncbi:MAG: leucine-rich repeat protein [Muribaculaceae bacterium]|nr:leucine-rich repeat protein [Muribaculaceae bacterium]